MKGLSDKYALLDEDEDVIDEVFMGGKGYIQIIWDINVTLMGSLVYCIICSIHNMFNVNLLGNSTFHTTNCTLCPDSTHINSFIKFVFQDTD